MDRTPSRSRRRGFRTVAVLLGTLVAFGAMEITLRLTQPAVDLDVMTGRLAGGDPMARWARVDAFCAYRAIPDAAGRAGKTVNSSGFISTPEIEPAKPAGTVRIAFLGGSSTAGTGKNLPDRETWPWIATELIRERVPGRRIEFLNGALGGYTTFESYGRLWSRIRFFEPDVVVVNHAWNDMYYFAGIDRLSRYRVNPDGGWAFDRTTVRSEFEPSWIDPWIKWSCLLTHVRRWLAPAPGEIGGPGSGPLATDFDARGLEVYRQNLRLILAAGEVLGFEVFVAKQPTLIVPGLAEEFRERCSYHLHGFDHDAHVRAFAGIYRVVEEEVPADRVVDLTPLSGDPGLFSDHVHPRPGGARRIAEIVAEVLAPAVSAGP